MSEHAYDITYLLESEPAAVKAPELRAVPARPAAPPRPSLAEVQEAIARDLMQAAEAHEELIRQYLCVMGDATQTAAM
ncbi:hypothetical protein [Rhodanobacter sp. T12-5]|jgi:hypothetical protein|uniref:hypothetical protein n=1 Tax=Rhodanobacter sp. T12-5 TaxID=2024611 RepID=UPI0011ECE796|nr:hypothetical protein [Rhodanobacter sp. T12-5]KAA0071144.1 hypothetical protein CIW53_07550 [Rhodanobacter sp. T12-5]HTH68903.1 hypothetical protein [Rhodanobacter sp.]